jgi:hypothetical protein
VLGGSREPTPVAHLHQRPDATITLALGIITVVIGILQLTGNMPSRWQLLPVATGVLTVMVAVAAYGGAEDRIRTAKEQSDLIVASIGAGIWTLFVGAAFAVVGGFLSRKRTTDNPEIRESA